MMCDSSQLLTHYHDDAKTMYEVFQRGLHISGGYDVTDVHTLSVFISLFLSFSLKPICNIYIFCPCYRFNLYIFMT